MDSWWQGSTIQAAGTTHPFLLCSILKCQLAFYSDSRLFCVLGLNTRQSYKQLSNIVNSYNESYTFTIFKKHGSLNKLLPFCGLIHDCWIFGAANTDIPSYLCGENIQLAG